MSHSGTYVCPACQRVNENQDAGTLWCRSEFGLTTVRCCKTQECARESLRITGWKLRKGNLPPGLTPEEREAILAARRGESAPSA